VKSGTYRTFVLKKPTKRVCSWPLLLVLLQAGRRCEYDAYGNWDVLEPNFADDPDGKPDFGNPYLFTGRRVDILDDGSLITQYNRNRYYDYYTGRWLTHDALGYADGMNLYEYVLSNPLVFVDPDGEAVIVITVCGGAAVTLTTAQAVALAFGVSVGVCMTIPECRALVLDPAAKAIAGKINAAAKVAKKVCKIRCEVKPERPHHWWWQPRWGWPPLKKCYMWHIRITCYFKGIPGSKFFETQVPYGRCYKFPGGIPPVTH